MLQRVVNSCILVLVSKSLIPIRCVMRWASFPTTDAAKQGEQRAVNDIFAPASSDKEL